MLTTSQQVELWPAQECWPGRPPRSIEAADHEHMTPFATNASKAWDAVADLRKR